MKQYQIDRAFQMLRNILSRALYKMHVVDHTFIGSRLPGASHHFSGEIAQRHVMAHFRHFDRRLPFAAAGIQNPQRPGPSWPAAVADPARGSPDAAGLWWCRKYCAKTFQQCHRNYDPARATPQANTKPLFCHTHAENEAICYKIRT
jgi:hypothetical protein